MANQLKMADVQAILALFGHGWSHRRISRELGVDRATVRRYVRLAGVRGSNPAMVLTGSGGQVETASEPNPAIALTGLGEQVSGTADSNSAMALTGSLQPAGQVLAHDCRIHLSAAWPWREVIVQKLGRGLCAQRIYQDLLSPEHGYTGSYHSVRRLVQKLCAAHDPPVRRMECAPAEEAQVDFGKGAPIVGPEGKRKTSWVFRIVLSHSRKGYSEAVLRQGTDEFLRCLENAFAHFGGVSKTLVIDNLRAAVTKADWFDPELCPKTPFTPRWS
jgi:transposase